MIYDFQKASIGKRFSAFLFDFIIFVTLAVGIACIVTGAVGYGNYANRLAELRAQYSEEYGVKLDITNAEYIELTEEEKMNYEAAEDAFAKDEEAQSLYYAMLERLVIILGVSPLISCIVLEFLIPLFLGNGQTLGKKIFGIGVMLSNGVKLNGVALFARAILGKFAIETAIPIIAVISMMFGAAGGFGTIAVLLIVVVNLGLFVATKRKTVIHDLVSYSVCVDIASQMIFDSEEKMIEYMTAVHSES